MEKVCLYYFEYSGYLNFANSEVTDFIKNLLVDTPIDSEFCSVEYNNFIIRISYKTRLGIGCKLRDASIACVAVDSALIKNNEDFKLIIMVNRYKKTKSARNNH